MIRGDQHVYQILAHLAPQCRSYLGIGVREGACLMSVVRNAPKLDHIVVCDTWGNHHGGTGRGSHVHIDVQLDAQGYAGRRQYLDGDSAILIPTLLTEPQYKWYFDMIFVDGNHGYDGALADLRHTWPLTRQYLLVHDIEDSRVWEATKVFLGEIGHECEVRLCVCTKHVPATQLTIIVERRHSHG